MEGIASDLKPVFDACDENGDGFVKTQDLIKYSGLGSQHTNEEIKTLLHKLDPDGVGKITFQDFCRRFHDSLGADGEHLSFNEVEKRASQDSDPLDDSCFEADSSYSTASTNDYNGDDDEAFQDDNPNNSSFRRNQKQYSTYPPPTEPRTKHRLHPPRLCIDNSPSDSTSEYQSEEGYEGFGESLSEESTLQGSQNLKEIMMPERYQLHKSFSSNSLPYRRRISANAVALLSSPRLQYQSLSANVSRRNSMEDVYSSDGGGPMSDTEATNSSFLFNEVRRLSSQVSILVENHKLQTNREHRFKEDKNDLSMRINALEDQLEQQHKSTGEQVQEESRKYKSALTKLEKENEEYLITLTSKLRQAEEEIVKLKTFEPMLRKELDACQEDKRKLSNQVDQLENALQVKTDEVENLRKKLELQAEVALEERHRHEEEVHTLTNQLEELGKFKSEAEVKLKDVVDLEHKSTELEERVQQLTRENNTLKSAKDELKVQLAQNGTYIMHEQTRSLADELQSANKDKVIDALRDQEEESRRLRGIIHEIEKLYPTQQRVFHPLSKHLEVG